MSVDLTVVPPNILRDAEKLECYEQALRLVEEAGCLSILTYPLIETYVEQKVRATRILRETEQMERSGEASDSKTYTTLLFRMHQCYVHSVQLWKQILAFKVSSIKNLPHRAINVVDPGLMDGLGCSNVISLKNNRQL